MVKQPICESPVFGVVADGQTQNLRFVCIAFVFGFLRAVFRQRRIPFVVCFGNPIGEGVKQGIYCFLGHQGPCASFIHVEHVVFVRERGNGQIVDIVFFFIVKRFLDETAYTGYDVSVNGDVQVFLFDLEGFLPFLVGGHWYLVGVQILDDVYLALVPAGSVL